MILRSKQARRGFTLVELTIVLGTIGIMMAGVWSYASSARQTQHIEQAVEAISLTADATRAAYGGQAAIAGGITTVMPILVQRGVMPPTLLRSTASTCNGVSGNYADGPWASNNDACGTFRLCALKYIFAAGAYTGDAACAQTSVTSSQYFAIEFTHLDYGSCVSLAERAPVGMLDVLINGNSIVAAGTGLPVAPSTATADCTAGVTTNIIDFVYTLRVPVT